MRDSISEVSSAALGPSVAAHRDALYSGGNLLILGGDASELLSTRIQPSSVSKYLPTVQSHRNGADCTEKAVNKVMHNAGVLMATEMKGIDPLVCRLPKLQIGTPEGVC